MADSWVDRTASNFELSMEDLELGRQEFLEPVDFFLIDFIFSFFFFFVFKIDCFVKGYYQGRSTIMT